MDKILTLRAENIALKKQLIETQFALLQERTKTLKAEEAQLQQDIAAAQQGQPADDGQTADSVPGPKRAGRKAAQ